MNIDNTADDTNSVYGVFYRLCVRDDGLSIDADKYQ